MALGTGFINRYQYDIFFRTETHVIGLQILSALVVIGIVLVGFNFFFNDLAGIFVGHLAETIDRPAVPQAAESIIAQMEYVKMRALLILTAIIISIKIVAGYFFANATLRPARMTLSAQKQFVGNVAHELRTPLTILKTNIEIALLDDIKDKEMVKMLESNVEELDRINNLINNLVSMNALVYLEPIEFKKTDFGAVVDGAVEKLTDYANRRELTVIVHKETSRAVKGNATALEQVVMNLLKNAIAYTPKGGKITVTLEPDYPNFVRLSVKDTGVGIDKKDLFHIFEPFYRADRARTREGGGSGLGLTIVHEVVKLHHGKISIQSALGKGTTVIVQIPCAEQEPPRLRTI